MQESHQTTVNKPARFCFMLAWLWSVLLFNQTVAAEPDKPIIDEETRQQLIKNLSQSEGFHDRFDAEVWLVDMTGRLNSIAKHIPKQERLTILQTVYLTATQYQLDPQLVLSIIHAESYFERFAISKAGALGLMQIMPFWKNEIGREQDDLMDIKTNIRYGCAILRIYIDREKKHLSNALASYNGSKGKMKYPSKVFKLLRKHWVYR